MLADDLDPLPLPPLPGYAPKLCHTHGTAHYARRDKTVTDAIVWACTECGIRFTTAGLFEEGEVAG